MIKERETHHSETPESQSSTLLVVDDEEGGTRQQCSSCTRRFAPESLERHVAICVRLKEKTVRVFDSTAQRCLSLSQQTLGTNKSPSRKAVLRNSTNVIYGGKKEQSIQSSRASVENRIKGSIRIESDKFKCSACLRIFSEKAAEKHVPYCVAKQSFPSPTTPILKQNSEQRRLLDIRRNYKPPIPLKSRQSISKN